MSEYPPEFELVELTIQVPLWRSIPPGLRLTVEDIQRKHARWSTSPHHDVERLGDGHFCEIAVRATYYSKDQWWPCGNETFGHARCKRHGGPGKPEPESQTSERSRLRRLVREIAADPAKAGELLGGDAPAVTP